MNTKEWIEACPRWKEGTTVVATATSLHGVRQGSKGEVLRADPQAQGFYIVRWTKKNTISVPWDSVEEA